MDKHLEKLKSIWPRLDNLARKKMCIIIEAAARRTHPLHDEVVAIVSDAGKPPAQKNQELDALLDPLVRAH